MEQLYLILFSAGLFAGSFLKGYVCRRCKEKILIQSPFLELANGISYVWVASVLGGTWESLLACLCASVLLALSLIDQRTCEIPLECNIFIGILGGIHLLLEFSDWLTYVAGMWVVSGMLLIAYYVTEKRGIGGGDIKLMAAAGLFLGWQKIILALFIGASVGTVIHLTLMKLKGKGRVLALGPYLAAGIFAAMLYGDKMLAWYLKPSV